MSRHATSDAVLRMMVGMRLEIGMDISQVRNIIDKFASEQPQPAQGEDPVGLLSAEDVPQHLRAEFLSEVASLSGQPGSRLTSPGAEPRSLSAADIWPSCLSG